MIDPVDCFALIGKEPPHEFGTLDLSMEGFGYRHGELFSIPLFIRKESAMNILGENEKIGLKIERYRVTLSDDGDMFSIAIKFNTREGTRIVKKNGFVLMNEGHPFMVCYRDKAGAEKLLLDEELMSKRLCPYIVKIRLEKSK